MFRSGGVAAVLLIVVTSAWTASAAQWIVVTAPAFRRAVEPLCQQRRSQGLHVVLVQTTDVLSRADIRAGQGQKLREHINKLCRDYHGSSYVLLVGAISAEQLDEPESKVVPALSGTVGRMKGHPSDNGYGCPDKDLLPTVAVGRFPARTEAEVSGMVAKTLEYEQVPPFATPQGGEERGGWRRRLIILAGIPAYNPLIDRLIENLALARLARLSPLWTGRAIYSNPQSRFGLPDACLHQRALQY